MNFQKKLRSGFFDAIDGTNFYAETAEDTAPLVDMIFGAIGNDCVLRTDKPASIARNADRSDFQADLVHNHHYKAKDLWNN
jgi:hypothetical protein